MAKKGVVHRKTILRILMEAKAIISDKDKWCQQRLALTTNVGEVEEYEVSPTSNVAVKFCALGAIIHVSGEKLKETKLKRKKANPRTGDKSDILCLLGKRAQASVNRLYDYLPDDASALEYSATSKSQKNVWAHSFLEYVNDKNGHGRRRIVAAMGHAITALEEELDI